MLVVYYQVKHTFNAGYKIPALTQNTTKQWTTNTGGLRQATTATAQPPRQPPLKMLLQRPEITAKRRENGLKQSSLPSETRKRFGHLNAPAKKVNGLTAWIVTLPQRRFSRPMPNDVQWRLPAANCPRKPPHTKRRLNRSAEYKPNQFHEVKRNAAHFTGRRFIIHLTTIRHNTAVSRINWHSFYVQEGAYV